eukprot:171708-Rhodomonas_salina.5
MHPPKISRRVEARRIPQLWRHAVTYRDRQAEPAALQVVIGTRTLAESRRSRYPSRREVLVPGCAAARDSRAVLLWLCSIRHAATRFTLALSIA